MEPLKKFQVFWEEWQAQFLRTHFVMMRTGKLLLDFSVAREAYYGDEEGGPGMQDFFEENHPPHQSPHPLSHLLETVVICLNHLGFSLGNEVAAQIEATEQAEALTEQLLLSTHALYKSLAASRNQYGQDAEEWGHKQKTHVRVVHQVLAQSAPRQTGKRNKPKLNSYVTIPENYLEDPFINDLWERVEGSDSNFFITGKAGTGKSTFLHYFARNTKKNVVLAAFTGIASINIGGTTLHSFFRFPFQPLLPGDDNIPKFPKDNPRHKIIEKMDTLIIDEVSMVRADIMEAVDHSLRINGGERDKPFGGKQLILIGDLFQLPPVVRVNDDLEWAVFQNIYSSPYFFSSPTFRVTPFAYVEMQKIHRQSNPAFKKVLNAVRQGEVTEKDLQLLNARLTPNFSAGDDEFVLTLVTTNHLAHTINQKKLDEIKNEDFFYDAEVRDDYPKEKYPTEKRLRLREGAQIIFIKNDINAENNQNRRWVNGTIAKIFSLDEENIQVIMEDGTLYPLEPTEWENRIYKFDYAKKRIKSEVIGTFKQYPIRLAWAITIHKSQGLTFDKVHLNTGRGAFSHGQTYVALSRCRSLEGLSLQKPIRKSDIILDYRVLEFFQELQGQPPTLADETKRIEFLLKYPEFMLRLFSLHYPFTIDELRKFSSVLPKGRNFYTVYDKQAHTINLGSFGLLYNPHIDWAALRRITAAKPPKWLQNLPNELPLDLGTELDARIKAYTAQSIESEDYEKAAKQVKHINTAKSYLNLDVPKTGIKELEKILRKKNKLQYLLSASFFANNFGQLLKQQTITHLFEYLVTKHKSLKIRNK